MWLFNNLLGFKIWFDADGGTGGGGAGATPKTFTQEELNAIAGSARSEGRTAYENDLLKKLGLKSVDDLTSLVTAARDADAKNKTELEKAQSDLAAKETELANAKAEGDKTVAGLKAQILNSEIKQRASAAVLDKDGKTVLRAAFRADAMDDVILLIDQKSITEKDGKYEGIDKALDALAKAKPYLLAVTEKPQGKGTPKVKEGESESKPAPKAVSTGVRVSL
jgi:hypothetical protein